MNPGQRLYMVKYLKPLFSIALYQSVLSICRHGLALNLESKKKITSRSDKLAKLVSSPLSEFPIENEIYLFFS
jgi:hypothetical protein